MEEGKEVERENGPRDGCGLGEFGYAVNRLGRIHKSFVRMYYTTFGVILLGVSGVSFFFFRVGNMWRCGTGCRRQEKKEKYLTVECG